MLHNICGSNNLPIIDNDGEFEENDFVILNNAAINKPNANRANIELITRKRMQIINSYFINSDT